MNLDELRSAQAKERRKDSLQHLRDAFYDDVAAYVADLRASRDRRAEQVENPFSDDDVRRLSDELETTEEVAEALYERRVGKVVKLASFAAADMSVDTDGMTTEERALFDDLVSRIRSNKSTVLATLSGETPVDATGDSETGATDAATTEPTGSTRAATQTDGPADATESSRPDTPTAADATATSPDHDPASPSTETGSDVLAGAMGPTTSDDPTPDAPPASDSVVDDRTDASTPEAGATQTDGGAAVAAATDDGVSTGRDARVDRETVRITRDVGAILGVDEREYELASDDVVTLPAANATPLVERDAAERIE
jgi:DNA replication factor GINS